MLTTTEKYPRTFSGYSQAKVWACRERVFYFKSFHVKSPLITLDLLSVRPPIQWLHKERIDFAHYNSNTLKYLTFIVSHKANIKAKVHKRSSTDTRIIHCFLW